MSPLEKKRIAAVKTADAINAIITYPALYNQLRSDGLDEVNRITWDKAGQKVIDIYHRVTGK